MTTHNKKNIILDGVLAGLMEKYANRVPDVTRVICEMKKIGLISGIDDIENDHIAFRTMGVPHLGIASFEKIFIHLGYKKKDSFFFPKKKLNAWWYSPPEPKYPRIFISELRVNDLEPEIANIIHSYTDEITVDPVDSLDLNNVADMDDFLHKALWRLPTIQDFDALQRANEYASWVIYNRYYLNHFTISVHNLPDHYNTIEKFNAFLKHCGFKLNDSSGEIKISKDGKLIQSSTVAQPVNAIFDDGKNGRAEKTIAGSYVEFAERRVLHDFSDLHTGEIKRAHRRDGFDSGNADGIFESTYSGQTQKHSTTTQ